MCGVGGGGTRRHRRRWCEQGQESGAEVTVVVWMCRCQCACFSIYVTHQFYKNTVVWCVGLRARGRARTVPYLPSYLARRAATSSSRLWTCRTDHMEYGRPRQCSTTLAPPHTPSNHARPQPHAHTSTTTPSTTRNRPLPLFHAPCKQARSLTAWTSDQPHRQPHPQTPEQIQVHNIPFSKQQQVSRTGGELEAGV